MLDFIRDVLKKISSMLRESGLSTAEAKILYENKKYLKQAEKLWVDALEATAKRAVEARTTEQAQKNTDTQGSGEDVRFSIAEKVIDENGYEYRNVVVADTNIFKGVKPRYWAERVARFIDTVLIDKKIPVYDENGNAEIIEFAKPNERVKKQGANNSHKVIDKLKRKVDNNSKIVIVNLEKVISQSEYTNSNKENLHQWLDAGGWEHRTAYIMMKNNEIYTVTLNVAKTRDGRNILYDVNEIKKVGQAPLLSQTTENSSRFGSPHSNSDDSLSQQYQNVNPSDKKISLSPTDSQGNALSQQQREYFKDSKVVDDKDIRFSVLSAEKYSYDSLISKPDMYVPYVENIPLPLDENGKIIRKDVISQSLKNIRAKNNPHNSENKVFLYNKDLKRDVKVTVGSIEHGLARKLENNSVASMALGEYFSEAICINELEPRDDNEKTFVLLGKFSANNSNYYVRMVVNEKNNVFEMEDVNVLYAINTKKESDARERRGFGVETDNPSPDSTISIAKFLEDVKQYFGSELSENVYDHFGEKRPKSKLDGLLYSISPTEDAILEDVVKENAELRSIISDLEKQTQLSNHELNDKDIDRIDEDFPMEV